MSVRTQFLVPDTEKNEFLEVKLISFETVGDALLSK